MLDAETYFGGNLITHNLISDWLRDLSNNVFDHIPEFAHNLDEATAATIFHCMVKQWDKCTNSCLQPQSLFYISILILKM